MLREYEDDVKPSLAKGYVQNTSPSFEMLTAGIVLSRSGGLREVRAGWAMSKPACLCMGAGKNGAERKGRFVTV